MKIAVGQSEGNWGQSEGNWGQSDLGQSEDGMKCAHPDQWYASDGTANSNMAAYLASELEFWYHAMLKIKSAMLKINISQSGVTKTLHAPV